MDEGRAFALPEDRSEDGAFLLVRRAPEALAVSRQLAMKPPNETARYGEAGRLKLTDMASLVDRYRKVKGIDLPAWQKRASYMLQEYVRTGNQRHLTALDALLDGIACHVSFR